MQRTCEGCGRAWQVEALTAPLSLLRCPYADCRCSFILRTRADSLFVQRARTFYRQRTRALRAQFDEGSVEVRADYLLGSSLVALLLSFIGIVYWVGVGWAFFLSLSLTPLLLVIGLERPAQALSSLGWLYLFSSLLVVSALTPSPIALFLMMPALLLSGLTSLLIIAVSSVFGGLWYLGLRRFHAARYAAQVLLQEKTETPRVEARQLNAGLPYR